MIVRIILVVSLGIFWCFPVCLSQKKLPRRPIVIPPTISEDFDDNYFEGDVFERVVFITRLIDGLLGKNFDIKNSFAAYVSIIESFVLMVLKSQDDELQLSFRELYKNMNEELSELLEDQITFAFNDLLQKETLKKILALSAVLPKSACKTVKSLQQALFDYRLFHEMKMDKFFLKISPQLKILLDLDNLANGDLIKLLITPHVFLNIMGLMVVFSKRYKYSGLFDDLVFEGKDVKKLTVSSILYHLRLVNVQKFAADVLRVQGEVMNQEMKRLSEQGRVSEAEEIDKDFEILKELSENGMTKRLKSEFSLMIYSPDPKFKFFLSRKFRGGESFPMKFFRKFKTTIVLEKNEKLEASWENLSYINQAMEKMTIDELVSKEERKSLADSWVSIPSQVGLDGVRRAPQIC